MKDRMHAYEDGYQTGRAHAREEILAALKKTANARLKEAQRLQRKIDDDCEQGSLMGYNYDGRIRGLEETLAAFESSLERQGLDLELDWS